MIQIKKSETADTRTCDWSKVSEEQLLESTQQHINDVAYGLFFFATKLKEASINHDKTKLKEMPWFYREFKEGFRTQTWYEMHKKVERHHCSVPEGVRDDINLVDVIEHIVDCVMAGMARSGSVYDLKIDNETLQKAFKNTKELLQKNVEVVP